jgi:hypothetical protein
MNSRNSHKNSLENMYNKCTPLPPTGSPASAYTLCQSKSDPQPCATDAEVANWQNTLQSDRNPPTDYCPLSTETLGYDQLGSASLWRYSKPRRCTLTRRIPQPVEVQQVLLLNLDSQSPAAYGATADPARVSPRLAEFCQLLATLPKPGAKTQSPVPQLRVRCQNPASSTSMHRNTYRSAPKPT